MPTERLYYTDSGLLEFSAAITGINPENDLLRIVLDKTAFYPTGGGQPNDIGRLGDADVIDVQEDESGLITHLVKAPASLEVGQSIVGSIDPARRLDHMQQHSGQHILSQAFVKACGAETRSFHLGAKTSTIDIELQSPTAGHMLAAEDIANSVIFDDRPMRVHLVTEEEAALLPLRKESAVKGLIRVIEVEDFDWSPCGGTHAKRAGQVGLIAIKGFERAKKMTRVEFVCGARSLADYRLANQAATSIGRFFSADRDSSPVLVEKMSQENKTLKKRVRELLELALVEEGGRLYAQAAETSSASAPDHKFKLISAVFDDRGPEELRLLAYRIMERGPAIVLLGSKEGDAARLVFARSPELPQNMGALLAEACQGLGGRGGGKPELAQGGGPNVTKLDEVIETASHRI
ncbi:MAG TPA: DHHA1 domain-containing protein [Blastocatellia bacterium]